MTSRSIARGSSSSPSHSRRTSAVTSAETSGVTRNVTTASRATSRIAPVFPSAQCASSRSGASTWTRTSSKMPRRRSVSRSRASRRGVTSAPGRARRRARSSWADAPGSGRDVGRPRMVTSRGRMVGSGAAPGGADDATAASRAAGARSGHSSRTTASGVWRRTSARTSRAASAASTCDTPTRCTTAPDGPPSRRTTRVARDDVDGPSSSEVPTEHARDARTRDARRAGRDVRRPRARTDAHANPRTTRGSDISPPRARVCRRRARARRRLSRGRAQLDVCTRARRG